MHFHHLYCATFLLVSACLDDWCLIWYMLESGFDFTVSNKCVKQLLVMNIKYSSTTSFSQNTAEEKHEIRHI